MSAATPPPAAAHPRPGRRAKPSGAWNLDRGPKSGEMGYLPGLDGIRALAVMGVLLYHANLTWLKGGFLGVDVFFVLSGFLITSLILEEYERSGRLDFGNFYLRRARRLLPALFLVLAACAVLVAFVARDAAGQFKTDALASLLYVTNWWYIVGDLSYFEAMGRPPLLQHLWSLAVEEQFYLIWPAVAFLLMKWRGRRGVGITALVVSLISTVWLVALSLSNGFPLEADPSRAYFGTDTHSMGLLLGAALAAFWRPGRLRRQLPIPSAGIVTLIGFAALAGVVYIFLTVGEYSPFLYRGGFLVLSAICVVLIMAATHPGAPFGRMLGAQPMRYIGQRSYGLYLWHWPIFMVLRPGIDIPLTGWPAVALQLGVTFVVAELSYRYVEVPIRHGALGRWWKAYKEESPRYRAHVRARAVSIGSVAAVLAALVGVGLATAPSGDQAGEIPADVAAAIGIASGGPTEVLIGGDSDGSEAPTTAPSSSPSPSASPSGTQAPAKPTIPKNGNGTLTAVGDSVLLGARVTLQRLIPGTQVDAEVSRQASVVLERIKSLKRRGLLTPTVLIHTGTNGTVTEDQLREMLDTLSDTQLVIVMNTSVPRPWEEPNNDVIATVVPDYPNAVIADWFAAADGDRKNFVSDGVHLSGPGMHLYGGMVKQIMRDHYLT